RSFALRLRGLGLSLTFQWLMGTGAARRGTKGRAGNMLVAHREYRDRRSDALARPTSRIRTGIRIAGKLAGDVRDKVRRDDVGRGGASLRLLRGSGSSLENGLDAWNGFPAALTEMALLRVHGFDPAVGSGKLPRLSRVRWRMCRPPLQVSSGMLFHV